MEGNGFELTLLNLCSWSIRFESVVRLKSLPAKETEHKQHTLAICDVLQAIERSPITMDELRETQLGVLTQPYKDSPDIQVQKIGTRSGSGIGRRERHVFAHPS